MVMSYVIFILLAVIFQNQYVTKVVAPFSMAQDASPNMVKYFGCYVLVVSAGRLHQLEL